MITISMRIDEKILKHLREVSHRMSLEKEKDIKYTDLIRLAIEKEFPVTSKERKNV